MVVALGNFVNDPMILLVAAVAIVALDVIFVRSVGDENFDYCCCSGNVSLLGNAHEYGYCHAVVVEEVEVVLPLEL